MSRYIVDPETGEVVDRLTGRRLILTENVNPGLSVRQAEQLMATLPDAQLAGYEDMRHVRPPVVAPRTGDEGGKKPVIPTYRPLAGIADLNRGNINGLTPIRVVSGATSFPTDGVIRSVVETPKGIGDDAEVINVNLGVLRVTPDNQKANQYISCILEWGIGGSSFSAEFDWINGVSFSIGASFVRVKAKVVNYGPDSSFDSGELILSASLAYGYTGQRASAIRKTVVAECPDGFGSSNILVNNATCNLIEIPEFAASFCVALGRLAIAPTAATPIRINQYSRNNAGVGQECVATYVIDDIGNTALQKEDCFPVANGARFLDITNFTGGSIGAAIGGQVVWQGPRVLFGLSI